MTVDPSNDAFSEALFAASRGWQVLPVHTIRNDECSCFKHPKCKPGKHPVGRFVPNGRDDATSDPAKISRWWTEFADANVGVATGSESGIVVLDIDIGHGGNESLADLEMFHGRLPHTVEAITGSGGRHIYFRHPGGYVPNSTSKIGEGLDIRGDGGFVVIPPSTHVSGGRYQWEVSSHPNEVPLADMPAWLRQIVVEPARRNGKTSLDPGTVTHLPVSKEAYKFVAEGAPVGQQRDAAIRAARSFLGHGCSIKETADKIWKGLQESECGDAQHPWTYGDAEDIVHDLASKPAPPPAPLQNAYVAKPKPDTSDLPVIYASCQDLRKITDDCWAAIEQANHPSRYFRHSGVPCRIECDDRGTPVLKEITAERLRYELARVANWKARKAQKDGTWLETEAKPPLDVMKDILATPNVPLPILTRIVEVPVFAADGTLQTTPGYHAAAKTYYAPTPGLTIPPVSDTPSEFEIRRAQSLVQEIIADFPFVEPADRAHAIALMLLPLVRDMIGGPTPNHLIEAPTPGSGKSLLARALLTPSIGVHIPIVAQPRDDDELRKRLTSQFREGRAAIMLDNVNQLNSGTLAAALTASAWEDRVLGKTETVSMPVRCAWVTTANNPTMTTEIARRCVRIRLDPKMDMPWQREGFQHENLQGWVMERRGELVWAALTLTRHWIACGKPAPSSRPLGSYEEWSHVIGGILEKAGIPGFLANLSEFYEAADLEGAIWRQFVASWFEKYAENETSTADLFPLAQESELFDLGKGGERSQKITFGKQLARQRDRVIGEHRIVQTRTVQRAAVWRLLPIGVNDVNVVNKCELFSYPPTHENINEKYKEAENTHIHTQHSLDMDPDDCYYPDDNDE